MNARQSWLRTDTGGRVRVLESNPVPPIYGAGLFITQARLSIKTFSSPSWSLQDNRRTLYNKTWQDVEQKAGLLMQLKIAFTQLIVLGLDRAPTSRCACVHCSREHRVTRYRSLARVVQTWNNYRVNGTGHSDAVVQECPDHLLFTLLFAFTRT